MIREAVSGNGMKGQLVFEFIIAALVLFLIVLYAITYLSNSVNRYHVQFIGEDLEGSALRISEFLLNDPQNGIVSEWPMLDTGKMTALENGCNDDYTGMLRNFTLLETTPYEKLRHINISVTDEGGTNRLNCGRTPPKKITKALVTRFGFIEDYNKIARIEIVVWW